MKVSPQFLWFLLPLSAAFYGGWKTGHYQRQSATLEASGAISAAAAQEQAGKGGSGSSIKNSILTPPKDLPDPATATVASLVAWSEKTKSDTAWFWLQSLIERIPTENVKSMAVSKPASQWTEEEGSVVQFLFARWAKVEPDSVITHLLSVPGKQLTASNLGGVLEELGKSNPAKGRQLLAKLPRSIAAFWVSTFASALGEDNPAEALALMKEYGATDDYSGSELLKKLTKLNPQQALAQVAGYAKQSQRTDAYTKIASAWAETDPDAALAWAMSLKKGDGRQQCTMNVIEAMSEKNPTGALQAMGKLPKNLQSEARSQIVSVWASKDLDAAVAYATAQQNKSDRQSLAQTIFEAMESEDVENQERLIPLLGPNQDYAIGSIAASKMDENLETAVQWLDQFTPEQKRSALRYMAESCYDENPEKALQIYSQLSQRDQEELAGHLAGSLADEDPGKAMEWIKTLPTESARKQATNSVQEFIAARDPESLLPLLPQVHDENERRNLISSIGSNLVGDDPEKTRQWAESLQGKERLLALSYVINAQSWEEPARTAEELTKIAPQLEEGTSLAQAYADSFRYTTSSLYMEDPEKAKAWLIGLPEGHIRASAVGNLIETWAGTDAVTASEWTAKLPVGATRDAASGALINQIAATDPESAWVWAGAISDQSARKDHMLMVAAYWRATDAAAARQAVENHAGLTPEQKSEILKSME